MSTPLSADARARRRPPRVSATTVVSRRSALRAALVGTAVTTPMIGCSMDTPDASGSAAPAEPQRPEPSTAARAQEPSGGRVLVAYYSRAGENYWYGGRKDLEVGNTEVLARMIAELLPGCDVYRIQAREPYSEDYDATVARNVREQDDDARPALAEAVGDLGGYDTVLLGSPIWNVRPPMIMTTFVQGHDLTGTRVLPFVTYAVSGLGSTQDVYAQACPGADLGRGLAVRGEEVRQARPAAAAWLREAGLLSG